ncbi:MAG: hypothetical protein CME84_10135 [Henriciella sp.]|nr:hypothetical protein [Henriciella sp.]
MPDSTRRIARLSILASAAGLCVLTAAAQSAGTYVANGSYSSDYEVSSWSTADRARGGDYLQQAYRASDELLGGPVAQPGEPVFAAEQYVLNDDLRRASYTGGASATRGQSETSRPRAGMRVETMSGLELGSVAVVQAGANGEIEAVWVRTLSQGAPNLVQIESDRIEVSGERLRVMG